MGQFRLWGVEHLAILAAVLTLPAALAAFARGHQRRSAVIGGVLAVLLAGNELVWWLFRYRTEGLHLANLPLQVCDLTVWMGVWAAIWRRQACFEFLYFAGLAGGGMALLTPDLWAPWPSYPSVYYFLAHGLVVVLALFLVWGAGMRLTSRAVGRFLLIVNGYALGMAVFNTAFQTNYLYLCRKPEAPTLLDYLGPWPWYLAFGELAAAALVVALWLPFSLRLRNWLAGRTAV